MRAASLFLFSAARGQSGPAGQRGAARGTGSRVRGAENARARVSSDRAKQAGGRGDPGARTGATDGPKECWRLKAELLMADEEALGAGVRFKKSVLFRFGERRRFCLLVRRRTNAAVVQEARRAVANRIRYRSHSAGPAALRAAYAPRHGGLGQARGSNAPPSSSEPCVHRAVCVSTLERARKLGAQPATRARRRHFLVVGVLEAVAVFCTKRERGVRLARCGAAACVRAPSFLRLNATSQGAATPSVIPGALPLRPPPPPPAAGSPVPALPIACRLCIHLSASYTSGPRRN
jgi:hypothetical protein